VPGSAEAVAGGGSGVPEGAVQPMCDNHPTTAAVRNTRDVQARHATMSPILGAIRIKSQPHLTNGRIVVVDGRRVPISGYLLVPRSVCAWLCRARGHRETRDLRRWYQMARHIRAVSLERGDQSGEGADQQHAGGRDE
jgi:hypothetical protein